MCISVREWDYNSAPTPCISSQPSPLGRRLPHPEIWHIVPSAAHFEGSAAGRTKLSRVAGRLSLISIMSLSCVRGLYSGWQTNYEDMMCCSVSSGSHMLCSPSRTSKSDLENEFKDTLGLSGCDFPTPVVMNPSVEFLTLVCSVQQRAPTHQIGESLHRSCSPLKRDAWQGTEFLGHSYPPTILTSSFRATADVKKKPTRDMTKQL